MVLRDPHLRHSLQRFINYRDIIKEQPPCFRSHNNNLKLIIGYFSVVFFLHEDRQVAQPVEGVNWRSFSCIDLGAFNGTGPITVKPTKTQERPAMGWKTKFQLQICRKLSCVMFEDLMAMKIQRNAAQFNA
jgi:hypothetical protein